MHSLRLSSLRLGCCPLLQAWSNCVANTSTNLHRDSDSHPFLALNSSKRFLGSQISDSFVCWTCFYGSWPSPCNFHFSTIAQARVFYLSRKPMAQISTHLFRKESGKGEAIQTLLASQMLSSRRITPRCRR